MTYRNACFDKIICVGKNYLDHALELGDAVPERPIFFFKPPSCLLESPDAPVALPQGHGAIHHECEIVFRIRRRGNQFSFDAATLGLDLTLRDLQNELKKKGQPWEPAKAFPRSAIIGPWISAHQGLGDNFLLAVNGSPRQSAKAADMRVSPNDLIPEIARWFDICDGDLLFTGTPKGVGPIIKGDKLTLSWGQHLKYDVTFE